MECIETVIFLSSRVGPVYRSTICGRGWVGEKEGREGGKVRGREGEREGGKEGEREKGRGRNAQPALKDLHV